MFVRPMLDSTAACSLSRVFCNVNSVYCFAGGIVDFVRGLSIWRDGHRAVPGPVWTGSQRHSSIRELLLCE